MQSSLRKARTRHGWALRVALGALALASVVPATARAQEPPGVVPVEQAVVRFAAGVFSLLDRLPARKVLPPSDALPDADALAGFWYEVRAADGSLRYRRVIGDPIRLVFEGPEPDAGPGAPASRKEAIPAERVFTLLIPAALAGDELVLFSSPLEPGAQGEPAAEVARLELAPIIIPSVTRAEP